MQSSNFFAVLALLSLACLDLILAVPSPGCGRAATITSGTYSVNVNGRNRQYIVRVPPNYSSNRQYRLIFTFHPAGGSASQTANGDSSQSPYYGLSALVPNNGAIFVSPDGLNSGWANQNGQDVTFVDSMIRIVEAGLCVDQNLRFATGFSYGGGMSYALACARPNDFRAVAILSGAVLSGCAGGNSAVPMYIEHGLQDRVLPIARGRELRDNFADNNGCRALSPEPSAPSGGHTRTALQGCSAGNPITWVVFDGGHVAAPRDRGSSTSFTPGYSWEFFSQFT